MNLDNIGLVFLGIIYLAMIVGAGLHFSPVFSNYDLHRSVFFKKMTTTLIDPTIDISNHKRFHQTHACLSQIHFYDKDRPYQIHLTDIPNTVTKERKGYFVGYLKTIKEDKTIALDNQHNIITPIFIDELVKLHAKHSSYDDPYDFYTTACTPVSYLRYHDHFYVYPININNPKNHIKEHKNDPQ